MSTAWIDQRIPGIVALTALLCCLTLSLAAEIQDDSRREAQGDAGQTLGDVGGKSMISDAVKKLADSPSYRWTTTVAVGERTVRRGWRHHRPDREGWFHSRRDARGTGRPEFVTRGGKTAILSMGIGRCRSASTPGRGTARAAHRARLAVDHRLQAAGRSRVGTHRQGHRIPSRGRHGDGHLEPGCGRQVARGGRSAAPGRNSGSRPQPFDAPIKDPRGSVTFRVDAGVLTEFTLTLAGSRRRFDNEIKLDRSATTKISDIGMAKVEVPEDAREIVEALLAGGEPKVFVPEPGFRKLFDGRTLAGWEGRPGYWSVEDRAIVGPYHEGEPAEGKHLPVRPGRPART